MPMHRFIGNGFWIGGGGGGTDFCTAKMCLGYKCVWEPKKKSGVGHNYPVPTTRSMLWCNFLWGLRNWLHNKAALFWLHT